MRFSHLFYKDILLDEANIFSANLTENNEVEQISFKKNQNYMLLVDCQLTKTSLLTFFYQTWKVKKALSKP